VVFDKGVAKKSEYRRFNIKNVQPGDDYAAIEQAVMRRYSRQVREQGKLPDLLIIDGGQGQLAKAVDAMSELGLEDVPVISVAKGPERKAGMEQIHLAYDEKAILTLPADSPALHLIQAIRDEAHRFAIAGHRAQRDKKRRVSHLEDIPGVGAKRRRALLNHFGGLQEIKRAGVKDLTLVPGINQALAQVIFDHLHG
jgi:excinuclease ABC subunit C